VQVNLNFYSAPHLLRGKELDVRVTSGVVEIFYQLDCVAHHFVLPPNWQGRYQTKLEHLPPAHLAVLEFTPKQALRDAERIGSSTLQIVEILFNHDRHPLLNLRRIQGILRLGRRHTEPALEEACRQLIEIDIRNPRLAAVEDIIKHTTRRKDKAVSMTVTRGPNPNLRGQAHWDDSDKKLSSIH